MSKKEQRSKKKPPVKGDVEKRDAELSDDELDRVAGGADYFLKIEGVDGESNDSKHKGEIEIESWSWGETQTSYTTTRLKKA